MGRVRSVAMLALLSGITSFCAAKGPSASPPTETSESPVTTQSDSGPSVPTSHFEATKDRLWNMDCVRNYLVFPDLNTRIELSPSFAFESIPQGFNSETLRVAWLLPNALLWIHWNTFPEAGTGRCLAEAHVILSVHQASAKEVLRQGFCLIGRMAQDDFGGSVSFGVRDNSTGPCVTRTVSSTEFHPDINEPTPLAVKNNDGDIYTQQFSFIQTTTYHLSKDHTLITDEHTLYLDLSPNQDVDTLCPDWKGKTLELSDIADFLVVYLCPRFSQRPGRGMCTAKERETMIAKLKELNPGIESWPSLKRRIRAPWNGEVFHPLAKGFDYYPFFE